MAWLSHPAHLKKLRLRPGTHQYKEARLNGWIDTTPPRSPAQQEHNQYRRKLGLLARLNADLISLIHEAHNYELDRHDKTVLSDTRNMILRTDQLLRQRKAYEMEQRKQYKKQRGG